MEQDYIEILVKGANFLGCPTNMDGLLGTLV